MPQQTKQKTKRKRTAAEIVAYQQVHSQEQVDELARQANDLPSLIAWAHRAGDFGLWLTRTTARRWKANRPPLDVAGLDMRGEVWPWLTGELHRLCGIGKDELWIFAVCYLLGKADFDGQPDSEQRYRSTLKILRDHERDDPSSVARLRAELRQRFPVAAVHIPQELEHPPRPMTITATVDSKIRGVDDPDDDKPIVEANKKAGQERAEWSRAMPKTQMAMAMGYSKRTLMQLHDDKIESVPDTSKSRIRLDKLDAGERTKIENWTPVKGGSRGRTQK